jgi:hypothetical protein
MVYNSHTNEPIGFNIKGVRHLIEELGLPDQKVYQLTNILDAIVNAFPDAAVRLVDEKFRHVLEEQHLQVELDVAA